jgi:hypothetical protein
MHAEELCGATFSVTKLDDAASSVATTAVSTADSTPASVVNGGGSAGTATATGTGTGTGSAGPLYGDDEVTLGRHLIRCEGIGFVNKYI